MSFFFLDDSSHVNANFCLSSFVVTDFDPQKDLAELIENSGLIPCRDEYKSSVRMIDHPAHRLLRESLKKYLIEHCAVGLSVSPTLRHVAKDAAGLFEKMSSHPEIGSGKHEVFVDQGIYPRRRDQEIILNIRGGEKCSFHFEQDSKLIHGIQLADLAAHTCSIMLKDSLGLIKKTVRAGENSGYDPDSQLDLGFEMFATIRYAFLGVHAPYSEDEPYHTWSRMLVSDHGLQLSEVLDSKVRKAAERSFSSVYLGCIH